MKITRIKLTDLKRPERNVRMHTDKQLTEFKRSVQMFGQIRPIVVDEQHTILAGNGLYDTLLALGHDAADCYVVTGLSDNEKKKLMLADNRIFSLGTDDLDAFEKLIGELNGDLDIPGYDDDLLQSLVADGDKVAQMLGEYGSLDDSAVERIKEGGQRQASDYAKATQEEANREQPQTNNPAPDDQRPSVICPKCGERLWL